MQEETDDFALHENPIVALEAPSVDRNMSSNSREQTGKSAVDESRFYTKFRTHLG